MDFRTEIEVRYAETDAMGIVHHSVTPVWFELARIRALRKEGFAYEKLEEDGFQIPVFGLEVEYLRPVHFGESVEVTVGVRKNGSARFEFLYEVFVAGKLCTRGLTKHVFLNEEGKVIRLPKNFVETLFLD